MTRRAAAQVLAQALSAAGVGAAYGRLTAGVPVTEVRDRQVAFLLAQAHTAVHGVTAIAVLHENLVIVPGRRPARSLPTAQRAIAADELAALGPVIAEASEGEGLSLELRVDLADRVADGPVAQPSDVDDWPEPEPSLVADLSAARDVVVLAGPDVVRRRAVGGLRALAAAGRLGVLNTWGAKGVFPWRSRHHWATVGLQELDFELGGLGAAGLVLAVGIDEPEAPSRLWAGYAHRTVAPELLGPLAERWGAPGPFPGLPPLRDKLAAVTQAGWAATGTPLMPSLVTRHYAQVLGHGGLVAADPGTAGFWVARTFATARLGSAFVPGEAIPGWAAACVLVARVVAPGRPALAVVDGPVDEHTNAVLHEAARLGIVVGVEAWQGDGAALSPDAHLTRLAALAGGGDVVTLAADDRQLAHMVAVAGPVRAWTADG